jgi:hypothetical protein
MGDIPPTSSASQLVTYAMCGRKYYFSYVLGLEPEKKSAALAFGSAVHGAIEFWFKEKIAGRLPLLPAAEQIFLADLNAGLVGVPDTETAELEEQGRSLVRLYLQKYNDLPVVAVEEGFEMTLHDPETGEILPRPLRGYFDLVLDDGRIIELKTAARKWGSDVTKHLQLGAYAAARNHPVEVHVLVRRRDPAIDVIHYNPDGWWHHAAVALERGILARQFPPSPGAMTCSTCDFTSACSDWKTDGHRRLPVLDARVGT